jgi:N-acetylmuramoyl-L-alanine amidase
VIAIALTTAFVRFSNEPTEVDGASVVQTKPHQLDDFARYVHAGYFVQSVNAEELKDAFERDTPLRILIVPGHTDEHPGAVYNDTREVDLTYAFSEELFRMLKKDGRFYVEIAGLRTDDHNDFKEFYELNESQVVDFEMYQKAISEELKNVISEYDYQQAVIHNVAPRGIAAQLYGINVYAREHKFDLVLHIHFNDHPRKDMSIHGKYTGYAMYVPQPSFSNSNVSREIAFSIAEELSGLSATSTHPLEATGVVEDSELIAIGAHNTARVPAILMEYGYVYEAVFQKDATRHAHMETLAEATRDGIVRFLEEK